MHGAGYISNSKFLKEDFCGPGGRECSCCYDSPRRARKIRRKKKAMRRYLKKLDAKEQQ